MFGNDRTRYPVITMTEDAMKARTKAFAMRVIRLTELLPPTRTAKVLGRQLLRSATSVGERWARALRACNALA